MRAQEVVDQVLDEPASDGLPADEPLVDERSGQFGDRSGDVEGAVELPALTGCPEDLREGERAGVVQLVAQPGEVRMACRPIDDREDRSFHQGIVQFDPEVELPEIPLPGQGAEALLVRPDGYVFWATPDKDLELALTTWFGAPA